MAIALLCLAFSFTLSVALTPIVRRVVLSLGLVDAVGRSFRKLHAGEIPRLGGIAIVIGFFVPIALVAAIFPEVASPLFGHDHDLVAAFFLGAAAIAGIGIYDDVRGATPRQKVAVQFLVALAIVLAGFRIEKLDLPFIPEFQLANFSYPITVLWIVGVTNAVNLIDGLDGLAAGISLIAVVPVAVVAVAGGSVPLALVSFALIGALAGFLVHNFHPAKIFMGDTGSMFLGFVLAVVTVQMTQKVSMTASLGAPLFALALPVFDTLSSMGRRAFLGKPVFSADRGHLHHRLLKIGFSHRGVVLLMYLGGMAFSLLALLVLFHRGPLTGIAVVCSALLCFLVLHRLGYFGEGKNLVHNLEQALEVRERNRAMYDALNDLRKQASSVDGAEEFATRMQKIAIASGASWVRIRIPELSADLVQGAPTGFGRQEIPFFSNNGEKIGVLEGEWPEQPDGAVLHALESARDLFEQKYLAHVEAPRLTKAA